MNARHIGPISESDATDLTERLLDSDSFSDLLCDFLVGRVDADILLSRMQIQMCLKYDYILEQRKREHKEQPYEDSLEEHYECGGGGC